MGQFFDQKIGGERLFAVQSSIQRGYHSLFDLRAAETLAGAHDFGEIECSAVLFAEAEVNLPDGGAFAGIG